MVKYLKCCRRCEKPFETNYIRKLYCGNTCKAIWLRENNLEFAEKFNKYMLNYRKQYWQDNKFIVSTKTKANRNNRRTSGILTYKDIIYIYERDNYSCHYCSKKELSGLDLNIDHYIPISKGGTNELNNLVVSCHSCNSKKKSKMPEEFKELINK